MKRRIVNLLTGALVISQLSACNNTGGLLNLVRNLPTPDVSALANSVAAISRQRVKVVFYNRLSNNELVPLVPDALESLRLNEQFSFDAAGFPRNKGLEQTFPFIEAGEHVIELKFQDQEQPIEIPIVVPQTQATETVILVILTFDANDHIKDVQVGYDLNRDLVLDANMNIYRSSNGQSYLIYSADGQVEEWRSPLQQTSQDNVTTNLAGPVPVGAERDPNPGEKAPLPQDRERSASPPPVAIPKLPEPKPLPLPEPVPQAN